ncbi:MAG TPA: tetratricopeptide repeat protein [Blastocatellia bacterium]|nr:tetratricopeptide repeat protein [Blastocatellia bacterium]
MFFSSLSHSRGFAAAYQSILCAMLIAFCAVSSRAQIGGIDSDPGDPGTGGRNIIQGNIYLPGGRKADKRAKIRLRSINSDQFTMSDDNGSFSFRRLHGGTYNITVDAGNDYEIAYETVDIIELPRRRSDQGQTQTVQITLTPKQSAVRPVGTVDASAGGIPEAARALYKEALEAGQSGDSKTAIARLEEALKIYPTFVSAFNELGLQYMKLKKFDKAEEVLRQALKLAPEAFPPRLNYGIVLLQKKDYVAAATELQRATQKDSSNATAHLHLGRAFVNLAVYNKAEKELQQAISLGGSEMIEAHRYLAAVYIETRENLRAADELEKYLALSPKAKDADKIRDIIKQLRGQK